MNWFKKIMQQLRGMSKGEKEYQSIIDTGKVIAPIAGPIVTQILTNNNLPVSGQAALTLLTQSAAGAGTLEGVAVNALSAYIAQHIALVPPAPSL